MDLFDQAGREEMKNLVDDLNIHSRNYHVDNTPEISDIEYDRRFRRLLELEEMYGALPDSPTQRVGEKAENGFRKIRFAVPMKSLGNVFNLEEFTTFYRRMQKLLGTTEELPLVTERKWDGCALHLLYKGGKLIVCSTRGDGYEGEDVTAAVRAFVPSIPQSITGVQKIPDMIEVRGEVLLSRAELVRVNALRIAQGEQPFANCRNASAGSLRILNPVPGERVLDFSCYGIGAAEGITFDSYSEIVAWLSAAGFPFLARPIAATGIDEVQNHVRAIEEAKGESLWDTDGAVIKIDSLASQRILGETSHEPRYAIAWKSQTEQGITRLADVIWSVARWSISPVAVLEPVVLSGVTVSRASLANVDEIARLGLRLPCQVCVERRGEVIPKVVGKISDEEGSTKIEIPTVCPSCGAPVVRTPGEVALRCGSSSCPGQALERIVYFAGKSCLNIVGLGEKNLEMLYREGRVKRISDIFRLKKDDLLQLERFAEKSADNLIAAIERAKNTTLARFITGLGIYQVGENGAKLLAREFATIEDLMKASFEDIVAIRDFGDKTALIVRDFFSDPVNREEIESLLSLGVRLSNPDWREKGNTAGALAGKTIVLTGTMPRPRGEVAFLIENAGGKVSSAVSKKTSFIVAGEDPGSKLASARALAVKIISYEELISQLS